MGKADPVAQGRPAVADQIGNGRGLGPAATDDHVGPVFHADLLDGRIDHAGADFYVKVLLVEHKIIHALEIDQQGVLHMGMGAGSVKSRTVRHVRDVITITDLDDPLDFFRGLGHDHAARDRGHDPFISQTVLVTSGAASISFTDHRVVGDILGADGCFKAL